MKKSVRLHIVFRYLGVRRYVAVVPVPKDGGKNFMDVKQIKKLRGKTLHKKGVDPKLKS